MQDRQVFQAKATGMQLNPKNSPTYSPVEINI